MDPRADADLRQDIIERVAAVEAAGGDLGRTAGLDDVELVLRLGLVSYTASVLRRVQKRLIREAKARGVDAERVLATSGDGLRLAQLRPVPWPPPGPHASQDGS